jgi:HK97 family phage portal protein
MIAETGSDIPWIPNEIQPDGTLKPITSGRFYDAVTMPNADQTQKEFKMDSFTFFLTTGDLFWSKEIIIGMPTKNLLVKASQLMEVVINQSKPLTPIGYKFQAGNSREAFTVDEIIHQKYLNPTSRGVQSLRGLSPLSPLWPVISADNQRIGAQESSMRNRGAAGWISNETDMVMSDPDRDIQQTKFDKIVGGFKNFNKVFVGKSKAKFHQIGMSPADLELLKTGIANLRTICNSLHAPSELFNDPQNKTHANRKTALKSFYENAVIPVDSRFLSKYNREIVSEWSKSDDKNYVVTQDLRHIGALQEDQDTKAARADKITTSISKAVAQVVQGLSPGSAAEIIAKAHDMPIDEAKKFVILKNTNQGNE